MGKITIKNTPAQICSKDVAEDFFTHGNSSEYANIMPEIIKKHSLKQQVFSRFPQLNNKFPGNSRNGKDKEDRID
jgi:hypothetical protein